MNSLPFDLQPGTVILADIDGTTSEHVPNPSDAKIVPEILHAAAAYNRLYPNSFFFVTGRDVLDAERFIHPQGAAAPRVPFLSNHGTLFVDAQAQRHALPYTAAEQDFIDHMTADTVHFFQTEFPDTCFDTKGADRIGGLDLRGVNRTQGSGPLVEVKGDGVIIYTKFMPADRADEAYAKIRDFYAELCNGSLNPPMDALYHDLQDDSGQQRAFALKLETADQMEIRGPYSKGASLFAHNIISPGSAVPVACLVDTLGPTGTDRTMAKAVRKLGGDVILVLNDRPQNHPKKGDAVYPDRMFQTPTDLGQALAQWVDGLTLQERQPQPTRSLDLS